MYVGKRVMIISNRFLFKTTKVNVAKRDFRLHDKARLREQRPSEPYAIALIVKSSAQLWSQPHSTHQA